MKDLHCGKTRCAHFNRLKKKKRASVYSGPIQHWKTWPSSSSLVSFKTQFSNFLFCLRMRSSGSWNAGECEKYADFFQASKQHVQSLSPHPPASLQPASQPARCVSSTPPSIQNKKKKPGESEEKEAGEEERQVWVNAEMSPNAAHHRLWICEGIKPPTLPLLTAKD